jgi:hypothetical protein
VLDLEALAVTVEESRDDMALLRLLTQAEQDVAALAKALREEKVAAAKRLHDLEVPMTAIARAAKMTDSYLARLVYAAGGTRRLERTRL